MSNYCGKFEVVENCKNVEDEIQSRDLEMFM